jgi:hypothetical protein
MALSILGQTVLFTGLAASAALMHGQPAAAEPVTMQMVRIASDAQFPGGPPNDLTGRDRDGDSRSAGRIEYNKRRIPGARRCTQYAFYHLVHFRSAVATA